MEELKKCPNCGFKDLMACWGTSNTIGMNCTCPNCEHVFGNLKADKVKKF